MNIYCIPCKVCGSNAREKFQAQVLQRYPVWYYHCDHCGFLQTEDPYWIAEAYKNSISITDTGVLARNVFLSKIVSVLIYFLYNKNGKFIDFAGGYGIMTRLMRDIGFDYYWYDLYTENIFAKGFEYNKCESFEVATAFECFEHFSQPLADIESILSLSKNIIFTTELLPGFIPPNTWWYYAFEQGQHIAFYSPRTCDFIAKKYGLYFYSHWGIHLLTEKKINVFLFNKLIEYSHKVLFGVVQKKMHSKTGSDRDMVRFDDISL